MLMGNENWSTKFAKNCGDAIAIAPPWFAGKVIPND
jgi:hypothetical protein